MNHELQQVANEILYAPREGGVWTYEGRVSDLHKEFSCSLPVFFVQDHNAAGFIWDQAHALGKISDHSTLMHVDAHDDLALRLPLPRDTQELSSLSYEVGSFILPRVHLGIIDTIVWMHPSSVHPPLGLGEYDHLSFTSYPDSLQSRRLAHTPHVIETIQVPDIHAEILDIDLDYFTQDAPTYYPDFIFQKTVRNVITELKRRVQNVKLVTVALSPGYIQFSHANAILIEAMRLFKQ
jgi:hypothetical protein